MLRRLARAIGVTAAAALLLLLLFLASCGPIPSPPEDAQRTDTPPVISPSPSLACETHTAAAVITATATTLQVTDPLTVTITLHNQGCVALGLPQYRLTVASDGPAPVLEPANPEPIVHSLGVPPGGSDTAQFRLQALGAGEVWLSGSVSFEVHLGYPGPAYWGSAGTGGPLVIVVTPSDEQEYLPAVGE